MAFGEEPEPSEIALLELGALPEGSHECLCKCCAHEDFARDAVRPSVFSDNLRSSCNLPASQALWKYKRYSEVLRCSHGLIGRDPRSSLEASTRAGDTGQGV